LSAASKEFGIHVENTVATATFGVRIPLEKIVKAGGMEYEPERFPGVVYRMKDPKAAALIFGSGKVVCTGCRNISDVKAVFAKVAEIIAKSGVVLPKDYNVQVENIVASAKLDGTLDLDKIAFNLDNSEYEPEQFPGLVHRMKDPKVAFLLFGSGKVICAGARNVKDIGIAMTRVSKKLKALGAIIKPKPTAKA
jgi:transcription initiation factor TFIID TATA-box-binding protein